ncbi:DegT/DnrJ/EryC1/StrS family aminotransferase [Candidatus Pelagibacter bacterium]|nr:DegT/DnrJ/EryC1/StrS family aminotransferase [Candidatus Pelagibacter bacterium]MDA9625118.1 DegT/DnrJ/EryC1/StrS family aminotransferase [Candidatus Pelagibacter bacterium]
MRVPFLDLKVKPKDRKKLLTKFDKVLKGGKIINGKDQIILEKKISVLTGFKYALCVGSGSSALYLALRANGIKNNDEVITTPFSWIITSNAISATGAKPIFVDIDENFNIDPNKIEKAITKKTKAIVPMHVGGKLCNMEKILDIAKKNRLKVIEDAAQSFSSFKKNNKFETFSDSKAFSFNPMKVLHAYGEAGAVTTNDEKVYQKMRQLRHAGTIRKDIKDRINVCYHYSLNHKIDTIQCSFLLENLKKLKSILKKRNNICDYYRKHLKGPISFQKKEKGEVNTQYLFLAKFKLRDKLKSFLEKKNIESKIFYSPLIPDAPINRNLKKKKLENSRKLLKQALALPLHENLEINQIQYVVKNINKFYE